MIRALLQKLSSHVQGATDSFKKHNTQYEEADKLEKERAIGLMNLDSDAVNGPGLKVRDLLLKHPSVKSAVDIGSGTGWSAAALATLTKEVTAIEPSAAAINISKAIYSPEIYPNVTWVNGLAEEIIPTLKLTSPTLFLTGCVLNHIRDKEVLAICKAISSVAPTGSVLSFAENWGDKEWHQMMWHVRTKIWWQSALPDWQLDFHGPQVQEKNEYKGIYHQGIHGVKIR